MPVLRARVCLCWCVQRMRQWFQASTQIKNFSGIFVFNFFLFSFQIFRINFELQLAMILNVCRIWSAVLKMRKRFSSIRVKWAKRKYVFRYTCLSMRVPCTCYSYTQCLWNHLQPHEFDTPSIELEISIFFCPILLVRENHESQATIVNGPWKSSFCRTTSWLVSGFCALTQRMTTAFLSNFIHENKKSRKKNADNIGLRKKR